MPPHSLLWTWEEQFSLKIFYDIQDSHLFIYVHIISGTKIVQNALLPQNLCIFPQQSFSLSLQRVGSDLKANQDTRSLLSSVPLFVNSYSVSQWKTKSRVKTHTQLTERIVSALLLHLFMPSTQLWGRSEKSPFFSFCKYEESDCSIFSLLENLHYLQSKCPAGTLRQAHHCAKAELDIYHIT